MKKGLASVAYQPLIAGMVASDARTAAVATEAPEMKASMALRLVARVSSLLTQAPLLLPLLR